MSGNDTPIVRAKKGVALSGIAAGSTALCTVGKSGNDLHYRGYDINDLADTCEFEEIAYLSPLFAVHNIERRRRDLAVAIFGAVFRRWRCPIMHWLVCVSHAVVRKQG